MRRCTLRAHLRLMTLSLMVMHACRRASRRPLNAARSCARRGPARNVLFCLQTLKNGTLTHPSLWEDYCLYCTVAITHGTRAWGDVAPPGAPCRQPRLRHHCPLCPRVDVVLPGRVTGGPPTPEGRYRPLHSRPAPCADVPHGPRSRSGLPSLCGVDPLV